jgi:hypothetical protein
MFGSVFRSILVIGTIYALSPVRLDATSMTAAQASPGKAASSVTKANNASDKPADPALVNAAQSAALAMVTGGLALKAGNQDSKGTKASTDQIGDLIALGKDVCLSNPSICADVARTAASSLASKTGETKPEPKAAPPQAKPQDKPQDKAAPATKPHMQAHPARAAEPDVLGALIEKVAPAPSKASPDKAVVKAQR